MEAARHVFDGYFKDETNVLVRHHLDSYEDLLTSKIPNFIRGMNPLSRQLGDNRTINIYIGTRNGDAIFYEPPVDDFSNAILPHECRLENKTYSLKIRVNIEVEYIFEDNSTSIVLFENFIIGEIPLMLKSSLCHLNGMSSDQLYTAGECKFELGGYFIIGGSEKVLLSQERLAENMFYATKRVKPAGTSETRTLTQKEDAPRLESGVTRESKYEYASGIRSINEEGTIGPYSHYLIIPPANIKPDDIGKVTDYSIFSTNRLALITLPGFTQPVPLISIFYALGVTNHQDIYDTILFGIADKTPYNELFLELILSHEKFLKQELAKQDNQEEDPNMLVLYSQTRTRTKAQVYVNIVRELFPHCDNVMRRKAYLLGYMTRIAMDVALGISEKTDREHYKFKRIVSSGDLCFEEFRRIYREVSDEMLKRLDSIVYFQKSIYEGKKLVELIQPENIGTRYWKSYTFMQEFEKSFKGKWGGKDGISQELSRYSYLGSIAHLRRINVDIDKDTKQLEPRRIHCSSWGLVCPTDNPDGHNVGLIKSLTLLCKLSTPFSKKTILTILEKFPGFTYSHLIHPSAMNPSWTRIYVNSDFVGVILTNTEELHSQLINLRRNSKISKFISLAWNRMKNEYWISVDAARPTRPVYMENVTSEMVTKKKWNEYLEYLDAQETETIRISMNSFSSKYYSEIHGSAIFSASASVIPYSEFNQSVRNSFSCQQAKQACSWYNTAFNKRFDTIATWLNYAQRPIAQTMTMDHIVGCLPYGQNPIVAIMVYGGHNQEDAVIMNKSALQRGLFQISYYHGYDISEEFINPLIESKSEFGNPASDPKYREIVNRKEGYDYSYLDSNGIIKKGSPVTDKTILVGILIPQMNAENKIIGYEDNSKSPKKGQRGFVDDIYTYETSQGLRCVKIRIVESRIPELGDKMAARHYQKGTCGALLDEKDMPFTRDGLRPDMIVNPHAFPTRMTIGQFIEMLSSKIGIEVGSYADATAFSTQNRVEEMSALLRKLGYHSYGHELMYNGFTGEQILTEIFMSSTYYIRMKQMVEDKINYRGTGPRKLQTRQPVEGRANDGGLKIGEMERDAIICHGISKFLNESSMERSDKTDVLFTKELEAFDTNPEYEYTKMQIPYSMKIFLQELESMHISPRLVSS